MIPAAFDYVRPASLDEAVQALAAGGDEAKVLGGGQSLMPMLRMRLVSPALIVDCSRLAELRGITDIGDALVIGAGTTHHEVMHDPLVLAHAPLIARTTAMVGDPAIRHRGTFGGSLAHADPAADLATVALVLGAEMLVAGPGGRRTIGAADFFTDYFTSALAPDEILVSVRVPKLGAGWGFDYQKFQRTAQAWAVVGVAAAVRRSNGTIAEARVGLTNMGPVPSRAAAVESAARGELGDGGAASARPRASAADGTSPTSPTCTPRLTTASTWPACSPDAL